MQGHNNNYRSNKIKKTNEQITTTERASKKTKQIKTKKNKTMTEHK